MKITKIETLVCHARMRNWIFVKVLTDQPGLFGWGEATLEWHTRAVVGAIEDISQLLIGEDPTRIEHLWQMMYRQHFWHGNGVVRATAISGIDIALWDLMGKALGQPVSRLLGGNYRDRIKPYASILFDDPPLLRAKLKEQLMRGFKAIKMGWRPFGRVSRQLDE